jgi:hypothetical protein
MCSGYLIVRNSPKTQSAFQLHNAVREIIQFYDPNPYVCSLVSSSKQAQINIPPHSSQTSHQIPRLHTFHHSEIQRTHCWPQLPTRRHKSPEVLLAYLHRLSKIGAFETRENEAEHQSIESRAESLIQRELGYSIRDVELGFEDFVRLLFAIEFLFIILGGSAQGSF